MTNLEIILLVFMFIGAIVVIYKDRKQTKLTLYSYIIDLIERGENRETVVFKIMTHFKLTIKEANNAVDRVDLSGLTNPYR